MPGILKRKNKNDYRKALINKMIVPVEQGEVTFNSLKTAYLSAGSGDTVIFLHGAGAGAVTWLHYVKKLGRKNYRHKSRSVRVIVFPEVAIV